MNKKYSDEMREKIMTMRRAGMTFRAIGERVGSTAPKLGALVARIDGRRRASDKKHAVATVLLRQSNRAADIPPEVLLDRDKRLNAELDANKKILGDPVLPRWRSNA